MSGHSLKILPQYFDAVSKGFKNFEVRYNDRNYKTGDQLILQEYDGKMYTGRYIVCTTEYILDDKNFCKEGFVILGLHNLRVHNHYNKNYGIGGGSFNSALGCFTSCKFE